MSALGQKRTLSLGSPMSLYPQKRTWFSTIGMSALCPEADILRRSKTACYSITSSARPGPDILKDSERSRMRSAGRLQQRRGCQEGPGSSGFR
jgi:hypothetical protein